MAHKQESAHSAVWLEVDNDQNILDEGRLTDEKSSCVHSWAQMRLDNALSNENFFHLNV